MSDARRMHSAHSGRVSDPVLWGFEGKELLLVAVGFGLSLACFRFLYGSRHWDGIPALIVGAVPVTAVISWILLLVSGKPRRFAADAIDWWLLCFQRRIQSRLTFLCPRPRNSSNQSHSSHFQIISIMNFPIDGYFCDDQILFDGPGRHGSIAKGFNLHLPAMEHASESVLSTLENELRVLLRGLKGDAHYQFRFSVGADYGGALLDYYDATKNLAGGDSTTTLRNQKFTRCWHQLEARQLRREQLHLYLNLPATTETSVGNYSSILASSAAAFEQYGTLFSQVLERIGGGVTPLDDDAHYVDFLRFFNPSRTDAKHQYDPLASIQENCFLSDASPVREGACNGFWMDGHYNGVLAIKSPPQVTFSGMITLLTGLPLLDYSITVNVKALDTNTEIRREEKASEKLQNALRHQPSERMNAALNTRLTRIRRLMSDEVVPFKAQFILRAWDATMPGLQAKLAALEAAIVKLHGATYYAPVFPSTARNFFIASMPGWTRDRYDDCTLLLEDHNLANLLPVASASSGLLDRAEAIYPGINSNLVGIKTFAGEQGVSPTRHRVRNNRRGQIASSQRSATANRALLRFYRNRGQRHVAFRLHQIGIRSTNHHYSTRGAYHLQLHGYQSQAAFA